MRDRFSSRSVLRRGIFSRRRMDPKCLFVSERLPRLKPLLSRYLENDFQLDRGIEWKVCDAIH